MCLEKSVLIKHLGFLFHKKSIVLKIDGRNLHTPPLSFSTQYIMLLVAQLLFNYVHN